jgi:asparagine synthase (glutamine-hydrolysing)
MASGAPLPGFLAADPAAVERVVGGRKSARVLTGGGVALGHWGLDPVGPDGTVLVLSPVVRTTGGHVAETAVAARMRAEPASLMSMLPPFAAASVDDEGMAVVVDSMGFRPVYSSDPAGEGHTVISTSASLAGIVREASYDAVAVAVQSHLGWQLGQRTLREGISKLPPRASARLHDGALTVTVADPPDTSPLSLQDAVRRSAALLRESLEAVLDDHPDAVLQLTGGQDSRILLSAVPRSRRRGLRAMTLDVPGGGDVAVAAALAGRDGLRHDVHPLAPLDDLPPADAWRLVRAAAARMDGTADPVAQAALGLAEGSLEQGVRISGLGGEVARGFYYVGAVRDRPYTRRDAQQLAAWRMFVNEAVERDALDADFAASSLATAEEALYQALRAGGDEWFRATDDLYLRHRMQRWAGVTDMAEGYARLVINPMLDEEFLTIAGRLSPEDKAESRFLASLQMELDPELGRIPLEGRPAPEAYANPTALTSALRMASTGRKAAKKIVQRLRRGNRAPAGGELLARKVVEHWRAQPDILASAAATPFLDAAWVERVASGAVMPRPSSVAFVANLLTVSEAPREWVG